MSISTLQSLHGYIPGLLTPTHPYIPFGLIDLYGASRLSCVIEWIASGVFDPPSPSSTTEKKGAKAVKPRATLLQELFGLMVVLFGGETFLALCTGSPPSWLLSPKVALLFGITHTIQTRTPLRHLLPAKPSLGLELLLSLPDAIGRALLLTKFTISPLLHAPSGTGLPVTTSTLLLVPFIIAVPFASAAFSTFNLFSPAPKLVTPLELRPGGWAYADTWLPVVIPVLFLGLIGPVQGWNWGLDWTEDEALVACIAVTWVVFAGKAFYNLGPNLSSGKTKIKTQ